MGVPGDGASLSQWRAATAELLRIPREIWQVSIACASVMLVPAYLVAGVRGQQHNLLAFSASFAT